MKINSPERSPFLVTSSAASLASAIFSSSSHLRSSSSFFLYAAVTNFSLSPYR